MRTTILPALALLLLLALPAVSQPLFVSAAGPRLSDAELFAALDLGGNGLETVRGAVAGGDLEAAKKAFAGYLRARTGVPWPLNPRAADRSLVKFDRAAADTAAAGTLKIYTDTHTFPNADVDWSFNVTVARPDLADDPEWQWGLNRTPWWNTLGSAYQGTGDEKYARVWVKQLQSWVRDNPVPVTPRNNGVTAWRTIETGLRMSGPWPRAFQAFLLSPAFGDEDIVLFVKSSIEHARHLRRFATAGNWLTMEMNGLYSVGALLPELNEAAEWRRYAGARLYAELKTQFLPDGAQIELAPGYHNVALNNILGLFAIAKAVGRTHELPADYVAGAEKAFDYNLFLMTPERTLPRFNDAWDENVPRRLEQAAALFPGRTDFGWIATDDKTGAPPKKTSHAFPYAGYFVMRSGWERDANYLAFDAGPLGYSHVHQDKLNVVLWAHGRELLFDSGGGAYEQSKWRAWATDTFSHNTVLVDNKPQRRQTRDRDANVSKTPINAGWESDERHDFARGVYDAGYGTESDKPATHTRRVLFAKPDVFVVVDTLIPSDAAAEHKYEARWHLLSTQTVRDAATGAVVTTDAGQPNLVIVPLGNDKSLEVRAVSAQNEPDLLGWNVRRYVSPSVVPATTVLHTRAGAKGTQHFVTLLLPLKAGQTNPVQRVTSKGPAEAKVLLRDGRLLHVTVDAAPTGPVRVREIR